MMMMIVSMSVNLQKQTKHISISKKNFITSEFIDHFLSKHVLPRKAMQVVASYCHLPARSEAYYTASYPRIPISILQSFQNSLLLLDSLALHFAGDLKWVDYRFCFLIKVVLKFRFLVERSFAEIVSGLIRRKEDHNIILIVWERRVYFKRMKRWVPRA